MPALQPTLPRVPVLVGSLRRLMLSACTQTSETRPVPNDAAPVDLAAFMGTWHVVANVPYFFENGKVATRDVYRLREDGRIDNDFVFKKRFGEADRTWRGISTVVPGTGGREWKVQFIWPFSTRLHLLELAADGQTILIVTHDMDLARRADIVHQMRAGKVANSGPPAEVFS
jgi:apolipoprotein D and lipocalin family protein